MFHLYKDRQLLEEMRRSILKANILMNRLNHILYSHSYCNIGFRAEIQIASPYAGNLSIDTYY